MTTSSSKNFNIHALRGANVDDMEIVETMGLDPAVAYTPEINSVMLDITEKDNMAFYMKDMSEQAASVKASRTRKVFEKEIKERLARKGMLK